MKENNQKRLEKHTHQKFHKFTQEIQVLEMLPMSQNVVTGNVQNRILPLNQITLNQLKQTHL